MSNCFQDNSTAIMINSSFKCKDISVPRQHSIVIASGMAAAQVGTDCCWPMHAHWPALLCCCADLGSPTAVKPTGVQPTAVNCVLLYKGYARRCSTGCASEPTDWCILWVAATGLKPENACHTTRE